MLSAPHFTATAAAATPCSAKWTAVQRAAVRRPAWNDGPVATPGSPFVRYLGKGETVTSCVVAVGRGGGSEYRECGGGSIWRIVPGGQVPAGCLKRK
ncbi:hypothetical protein IPZ69_44710 [Streptomyces olivochromogenes]|nr:hypothetical protein [Streptomyces olivochromogenes]